MSTVKCKESLKGLLEERAEWEKEAKGHMAIILEKALKLYIDNSFFPYFSL